MRFSQISGRDPIESISKVFADAILKLKKQYPINVIFSPHIYKDINLFSKILNYMPDEILRSQVTIAPYLTGFSGANEIFNTYYGSAPEYGEIDFILIFVQLLKTNKRYYI